MVRLLILQIDRRTCLTFPFPVLPHQHYPVSGLLISHYSYYKIFEILFQPQIQDILSKNEHIYKKL